MNYEYDVFVSYRRLRFHTSWMVEYFLPYLEELLTNYVAACCDRENIRVFFDQSEVDRATRTGLPFAAGIEPGEEWQKALSEGIRKSRCMVALYSPTYFQSKWCLSELEAFEARAALTGATVIIPISVFSLKHLPARAQSINMFSLDDFVIDGPSLRESKLFPEFIAQMKIIAEKVAHAVCDAPEFVSWPTPSPQGGPDSTPTHPVGRFR